MRAQAFKRPAAPVRVMQPVLRAAGATDFYALRIRPLWDYVWRQPPSFWFICTYLFFEYVRPQSIYPALEGLPWAFAAIVGCLIAVLLEGRLLRPWTSGDTLLAVFTAVVLLSSAHAVYPNEAFAALRLYLSWVLIYWLITTTVDTEKRFFIFMCLFFLFSLKMSQHASRSFAGRGFEFRSWGAVGGPGWFRNSGEMAIQMTIFLPLSAYFVAAVRPYCNRLKRALILVLPGTAALALIASSSRGGQIAGAAVVLWMLLRSRNRLRALLLTGVLAVGVLFLLPQRQWDRLSEMGEDDDSVARLTMWQHGIEIANEHPVLGIGYANWLRYYRENYDPRGLLPHNIFVEAGAELGYTGLAAFLAMIVGTFLLNRRTRKLAGRLGPGGRYLHYMGLGLDAALVGYLVSGFFVTVLYYPFFWINFAMTVALCGAARRRVREELTVATGPARAAPVRLPAGAGGRVG